MFFTTGRFTRDSIQLLRQAGVVAMDGSQLATLLADRKVGYDDDSFSKAAFFKWLEAIASG